MKVVIYSGSNLAFVSSYDGTDYAQWNQNSGPIVDVRRAIRDHHLREQDFKCAYCRVRRQEAHGLVWDVEHILPKSLFPLFLYEPRNLVLVCKECNIAKGDKAVLSGVGQSKRTFPSGSADYLIVHPHFDVYSEHIDAARLDGKLLFFPRSDKGRSTIYICDLLRFSYRYGGWDSFDSALVEKFSDFLDKCPADAGVQQVKSAVVHIIEQVRPDF